MSRFYRMQDGSMQDITRLSAQQLGLCIHHTRQRIARETRRSQKLWWDRLLRVLCAERSKRLQQEKKKAS